MNIPKYIKKPQEVFLIVALFSIIILYISQIIFINRELNSWYDNNTDKDHFGLRGFYYNNQDLAGDIEKIEIIERFPCFKFVDKEVIKENFGLRAIGIFSPSKAGHYKFFLRSDDGSKLYINQRLVIDNGGTHPSEEKAETVYLENRRYLVVIEYFQAYGEAELDFNWLKTKEEKKNSLGVYFRPVKSNFQWDKSISQYQRIIKDKRDANSFLLWAGSIVIFIWLIIKFGRMICLLLRNCRGLRKIYREQFETLAIDRSTKNLHVYRIYKGMLLTAVLVYIIFLLYPVQKSYNNFNNARWLDIYRDYWDITHSGEVYSKKPSDRMIEGEGLVLSKDYWSNFRLSLTINNIIEGGIVVGWKDPQNFALFVVKRDTIYWHVMRNGMFSGQLKIISFKEPKTRLRLRMLANNDLIRVVVDDKEYVSLFKYHVSLKNGGRIGFYDNQAGFCAKQLLATETGLKMQTFGGISISGVAMEENFAHNFLKLAPLDSFLFIIFLLSIPLFMPKLESSTISSLAFLLFPYLILMVDIITNPSVSFPHDTRIYHFKTFWYFANSIAQGFGIPKWFPVVGGIPIGPTSISLFYHFPHRIIGYLLYVFIPILKPVCAFNLQLCIGIIINCTGWWFFLYKLTHCRLSAVFGTLMILLGGTGITLHQEQVIATITWVPWILLCLFYIRKQSGYFLILAILLGFSLSTHQPQIQILTGLVVFCSFFIIRIFSKRKIKKILFFIIPSKKIYIFFAIPLIIMCSVPSIYLYNKKKDFVSSIRLGDKLGAETWVDYVALNTPPCSSAASTYLQQYIKADYNLPDDPYLFFVGRIGIFFGIIGLFLNSFFRISILLCAFFLGLCAWGIYGPLPRFLFEMKFPFISYFRQWYHFGPMLNYCLSVLGALGFCSIQKTLQRWVPRYKLLFLNLFFLILITDLYIYALNYKKRCLYNFGMPLNRPSKQEFLAILANDQQYITEQHQGHDLRCVSVSGIMSLKRRDIVQQKYPRYVNFVSEDLYYISNVFSIRNSSFYKELNILKKMSERNIDPYMLSISNASKAELGHLWVHSLRISKLLDSRQNNVGEKANVILNVTPSGIVVKCETKEPVLLVTPFSYSNNFQGLLNNKIIKVWRVNGDRAGVILSKPGNNCIKLYVNDRYFELCLLIYGLFLLFTLMFCYYLWRVRISNERCKN